MIKYSFALCENKIVHIDEVTVESRKKSEYRCLCCNNKMAAHILGERANHFQHINQIEHDNETYIHIAAKTLFKTAYLNAIRNTSPIWLYFKENTYCNKYKSLTGFDCPIGIQYEKIDLTQKFVFIDEEVYWNGFKPDILLKTENNEPLFIEFKVTHGCSDEKIRSGIRIIEIALKDERSLKSLSNLSELKECKHTRYYNFKVKNKIIAHDCTRGERDCRTLVNCLIVKSFDNYTIEQESVGYLYGELLQPDIKGYTLQIANGDFTYQDYVSLLDDAKGKSLQIKNCINCTYHSAPWDMTFRDKVYCNAKKVKVTCKEAIICKHYDNSANHYPL